MNLTLTNYDEKIEKIFMDKFGSEKWIVNKTKLNPVERFEEMKNNLI